MSNKRKVGNTFVIASFPFVCCFYTTEEVYAISRISHLNFQTDLKVPGLQKPINFARQ